jgi:hypothetical protein
VGQPQQSDGGVQCGHGSPGGQVGFWGGAQLQAGSGDDAQRALAAHKQVAQVIAGVVFAQAGQAMPDLALRGDHFQAQAKVAGIAIAHHLGAARVGGQVAANGATAFGGQAQGEQQASAFGGLLHGLQHAARLGHQCEVGCVHTADGIHALQAQYHFRARCIGHASHHQTCIAPLRDDGHACGGTGLHHRSHLGRVARSHHGQCHALLALAPVVLPGRQVGGRVVVRQHMGFADDGMERIQQVCVWHKNSIAIKSMNECAKCQKIHILKMKAGRRQTCFGC